MRETIHASIKSCLLVACAVSLAACSSSGNDGDAESSVDWIDSSVAGTFDKTAAENIRSSFVFQNSSRDISDFSGYGGIISNEEHSYELTRLHIALSGGLSGAGELIAVVDTGFRTSHELFDGKTIRPYGDISPVSGEEHGTAVAAVAAGNDDTGSTMGVAPNAALHLTSYFDDSTKSYLDLDKLTQSTLQASSYEAVAQNNSWGLAKKSKHGGGELLLEDVEAHMTNTGDTVYEALAHFVGDTPQRWRDYYDALDSFQKSGTVVFALSNDENLTEADYTAAAPHFISKLDEAWLSAGNGAFSTDSDGHITDAQRLSAPCGSTASYCLFADGTVHTAWDGWDSDYAELTGTSFVAPQISGGLALIAEAFPGLSAHERTKRLLASANNNFNKFSKNGVTDFGNGVERYYSNEWGHGVMDLEAALSPIGTVSMVNGRNVATAERTPLERSFMTGTRGSGDGLSRLLDDNSITVFDALNANFEIPATAVIGKTASNSAFLVDPESLDPETASRNMAALGGEDLGFSVTHGTKELQATLGLSSRNVSQVSVLSLANTATAMSRTIDTSFGTLGLFGFTGPHEVAEDGTMNGFGTSLAFETRAAKIMLSTSFISEQGAFLGMRAADVFGSPQGASIPTVAMSVSRDLSDNTTAFAGLEYGGAFDASGTGQIRSIDNTRFTGFQLGLSTSDVFGQRDELTFSLAQPMRLESGTMTLRVPDGRRKNGSITHKTITGPITPSGRQLDLGVSYRFHPGDGNAVAQLGFTYSHDAGHIEGRQAARVTGALHQNF